jgi:hypothetical protein
MTHRMAKSIQLISAAFIVAVAMFGYGVAVARYEIWPYQLLHDSSYAVDSIVRFGEIVPPGRRIEPPPHAARQPFTINDPARIGDGQFVFLGSDDSTGGYSAWLYDAAGTRLHTWRIDYPKLDPSGPSKGTNMPHAFQVLRDGSVLVSFDDGDVMARIDACSTPIWIRPGIFHHAMTMADDGSVWVWRADGSHYAQYHYLLNFNVATGETIREIGLIEDIIQHLGPNATAVFSVRPDHPFRRIDTDPEQRGAVDFFHPNDVDVLSAELAPQFPLFEAGDLLLSFREIDLVAVVDPDTAALKWWSIGPWLAQHDPDFLPDGRISVFSNNPDRGRSEILKIEPNTKVVTNDLSGGKTRFYSSSMGTHQYQPNGNILITVPDEGRVLLVSGTGDPIMEFNNVSSKGPQFNEHVESSAWFPPGYFGSTSPECPIGS